MTASRTPPLTVALWIALLTAGCEEAAPFLPCGVSLSPGSSDVRTCDGDREVCICATLSCARRELDQDGCRTGYRYLDSQLADERYRGECVDSDETAWRVERDDDVKACGESPPDAGMVDAAVDAAIDAAVDAAIDAPAARAQP